MAKTPPFRPSGRWHSILVLLAVVNLVAVVMPVSVILAFALAERFGAGGIGIAALPFGILLMFGYIVMVLNVGVLAIYWLRQRPRGRNLFVTLLVMAASAGFATWAYLPHADQTWVYDQPTATPTPTPTPTPPMNYETRAAALELVNSCKVRQVDLQSDGVRLGLSEAGDASGAGVRYARRQDFDVLKAAAIEHYTECEGITVSGQ